jgi:G3E family GTPase
MSAPTGGKIPVLVVGGFLGSGKTTLLRRSLAGDSGTAIIVNEFGEVSHDHTVLRGCAERVSVVSGGCACCAKREDLVQMLRALLDDHDRGLAPLERVVIEMSGLADPAPVLFTIGSDPMLRHHFDVRRVITTVDALNAPMQLAAHPESIKQVVVADVLVITKTDLASVQACDDLCDALVAINPAARVCRSRDGVIDGAADREAMDAPATPAPGEHPRDGVRSSAPSLGHTDDVHATRLDAGGPLDWPAFVVWLSMLLHARGEHVLRVKGLLELDDGSLVSINGVQHIIHEPQHFPVAGGPDEPHQLILISRGMDTALLSDSLRTFQRAGRPSPTLDTGRVPSRQP